MRRTALLGAASLAALLASPVQAQSESGTRVRDSAKVDEQQGGIAEIVVTAQRREESVQDVPIAITALDAATLETRGVSSALEIAQFVPNLVGLNNTGLGTANAYYLRGIGNTESIATFDPPIGTYIDDIYISRQNANNFSFFDVQRVEILRGPQGTLFGRNTTGGAISVIMREPGKDIGGYVEAGYGSYNRKFGRGSIDLPLAPTFAIKISGYWQDDHGYAKNTVTGERTNENDGWGVRVGARGELSDSVRWTGSFTHTYADSGNLLNFDCNPANPSDCNGRFVTTGLTRNGNFGGLLTGDKNNYGLGNQARMNLVASNFEVGLGGDFKLNVITGFVDLLQKFALDFADGRGLPSLTVPIPPVRGYTLGGFTIANKGQHNQFTQEFKLTGSVGNGLLDIVTGAYYFNEDNDTDFGDIFNLGLAPPPAGFPFLLADRRLKNKTDAWAGYFQGDVHVTDQLTLTAGIRYTDERKNFSISDNRPQVGVNGLGRPICRGPAQFGPSLCITNVNLIASNGAIIPRRQNAKVWTPRFAINYRPNSDLLVFASATRGFKSGGWNARGTAPGELLPFGPEKAWSYEAGFKADLFDRRLRANFTAFLLDVSALQTPSAFIRANGSLAFVTRNFADYRNKGVELELQALPTDRLNLFASVGYSDDNYRLLKNAPALDAFGVQSVVAQQAVCQAQLAAGGTTGGRDPDGPGPLPSENATACGVGIVAPDGSIAEPVRSPRWTVALGGSYEAPLGGGLSLIPAANANWRAKSEVGTSQLSFFDQPFTSPRGVAYPANTMYNGNFITGSFSKARWIANASLTLKSNAGWQIVGECKNCFDQESVESALANYSYLNPPRTWAIRAKYDF